MRNVYSEEQNWTNASTVVGNNKLFVTVIIYAIPLGVYKNLVESTPRVQKAYGQSIKHL